MTISAEWKSAQDTYGGQQLSAQLKWIDIRESLGHLELNNNI